MLARVTTAWVPPSRLDEAVRFFEEEVVPAMREQQGLNRILLLTNPPKGELVAIGLWESREDLEASGFLYQELRDKFGRLYGGPPPQEPYVAHVPVQAIYEVRTQG